MSYDFGLVLVSFFIAVFAAFTALQLAIRIPSAVNQSLYFWVSTAGVALGGGIWSMHFIAMIAMEMPFDVYFDGWLTTASIIVAIFFVSLGLLTAGKDLFGEASLVVGGIIAGLGISAMHYMGMFSLIMPADIIYDPLIVTLSVLVGIVASIAALWLAFNLRGGLQRFGSAFVMGLATCSMHYTGMYGVTMKPNPSLQVSGGISATGLEVVITMISVSLLIAILFLAKLKNKQKISFAFK